MPQESAEKKTPSLDEYKQKLKTLERGGEVFKYLGDLWMKQHKITQPQYEELWEYWQENKPKIIQRPVNAEEKELLGDLADGATVEEIKNNNQHIPVEEIPF